jgi:hypothetical protein
MGSSRMLSLIQDEEDDRRAAQRARVLLSAQLHSSSQVYRVRIRDVSATGARVEADGLPRQGAVVCLQRGSRLAYGVMAWVAGDTGGITFDEPVAENHFGGNHPAEAPAGEAPYRRPGFGRHDETARYSDGQGWIAASDLRRPR